MLKLKLNTAPVLALHDFSKPFDVTTDESVVTVGGELAQGGRPVAFYSKKLTPAESRYHVMDRELMSVYLGCMKWCHYLHGNVCNIYSDHEPLIYIFVQPHLNTCQARWLEQLSELNLKVHYVPGKDNVVADVLFRYG